MRIRIEANEDPKHYAEVGSKYDDLDIWEVWKDLIVPMLIAFGYLPETVGKLVRGEDEDD